MQDKRNNLPIPFKELNLEKEPYQKYRLKY